MVTDSEIRDHNYPGGEEVYLSIIIRTRNEAENLRKVFEALTAQRCTFKWEVIVVDNESEDETLELCKQYGWQVVPIRRGEFTYGRALNLGISHARGELVLILSAHAVPVGSFFLESAVAPFSDSLMAAVRCLSAYDLEQMILWYKPRDIQYQSLEEQRAAETGTRWTSLYPVATCCVIRRSVWEHVKYDEYLEANEDKLWASQVLSKGYKVRCCVEAVFIYTRVRGKAAYNNRIFREYRALNQISGYVPLSWPQFFVRVARAVLLAPLVAFRDTVDKVVWNVGLVTIPWQVKFAKRGGSFKEFDKRT